MTSSTSERIVHMPLSRRLAMTSAWGLLPLSTLTYSSHQILLKAASTALALTVAIVTTMYITLGWGERDAANRRWWAERRGKIPR